MTTPPPRLILASASPRRQELLRQAGYSFAVHPADIDEAHHPPGLRPSELARHLAFEKAHMISARFPDDVVLGADTVVAFGEQVLGKPRDAAEARKTLTLLAGTTHVVITGVAVLRKYAGLILTSRVLSGVRMRDLSPEEIDTYVATGQWKGKAGGYGIQDDDPFVIRLAGCYSNIVGLPVPETVRLLAQAGVAPATPSV